MPNFWPFNATVQKQDIAATVPLVTDLSALQYPPDNYANFASEGYGRNAIVYACIRELSTAAASVRYLVESATSEGGMVEDTTGRLAALIQAPNPLQDWYTFIERIVTYLHVSGNCYVLKQRNQGTQVNELWLLRPDRVNIIPKSDGRNDYSYEMDGRPYHLPFEDVGHLKLPNPSDDNFGLSPLHVVAKTINLDMAMTDFSKAFFENAGVPSGLLRVKRRLTSQEEASTIRSRWRSSFGGARNMHSVAILDDDATYEPMASAPKDMAMIEMRNITETRICAALGVPPVLISANVGLERSTYNNYREARFAFFSETIAPLVTRIVRFFNFVLGPDFQTEGQIAVDMGEFRAYLDEDDSVTNRASTLFTTGLITLNEARQLVGVDAVQNGDLRRIPAGVIEATAGEIPEQIAEPVQAALVINEFKGGAKALDPVTPGAARMRDRLLKERENLTDKWTPKVEQHFIRLKNRIDGIIGRMMERGITVEETKELPFGPDDLIPDGTAAELGRILQSMYIDASKHTFDTINDSGIAGTVQFSESSPIVTAMITNVPERTNLIHATTKKHVREAVETALARGYSIEQLARGVPADGFPGLQKVLFEPKDRARLIARTEIMRTQNRTTTRIYQSQGFEYVRADDVDGDKNDTFVDPADPYGFTCAQRHNSIYNVDDAWAINDHPNGTLNWAPMPRSYKP